MKSKVPYSVVLLLQSSVGSHEKSKLPLTTVAASVRKWDWLEQEDGEAEGEAAEAVRARPCPTGRQTGFLWANRRRQKRIWKFLNGEKIYEYYSIPHQHQGSNMNSWWYDSMLLVYVRCSMKKRCVRSWLPTACDSFAYLPNTNEMALFGLHAKISMFQFNHLTE